MYAKFIITHIRAQFDDTHIITKINDNTHLSEKHALIINMYHEY